MRVFGVCRRENNFEVILDEVINTSRFPILIDLGNKFYIDFYQRFFSRYLFLNEPTNISCLNSKVIHTIESSIRSNVDFILIYDEKVYFNIFTGILKKIKESALEGVSA